MRDNVFVQARQDARHAYETERGLGKTHDAAADTATRLFRERLEAAGATDKQREDLMDAFTNDIVQLGDAWMPHT